MSSKSKFHQSRNQRLRRALKATLDFSSKVSGRFLNRAGYGDTLSGKIRECKEENI